MADPQTSGQTGNWVIDRMTAEDWEALRPHLARVRVAKGDTLIRQGSEVQTVHFPITADLSNIVAFSDGRLLETSSVGRDGVSGLAAFLADAPIAWEVEVQTPGEVLQISADRLRRRVMESPTLLRQLLLVTHDTQSQAAQVAACNALHEVTPRLARWLLTLADRTERSELAVTQQDMAAMLGTQRTSVNAAAAMLRDAGAVRYRRGRLTILDHALLEDQACECYSVQRMRTAALGLPVPRI